MDLTAISNFCNRECIEHYFNANTAQLTTINVGDKADIIIYPKNIQEFCRILDVMVINNYKFVVIGNGSNCYFCQHYEGIVIVTKYLNEISLLDNKIIATCGAQLTTLARYSLCHLLSGLEFAYGIPGTVGGAIYMNAAAFGSAFQNIVESSLVYDITTMSVKEITYSEHQFQPKQTIFSKERNYILLRSIFKLSIDSYENIYSRMMDNLNVRIKKQPLDMPSAGSSFKRPNINIPASKLIDEAGLKGYKIGGAEVSEKHAGFIVNSDNAIADDINNLIAYIKEEVYKKFSLKLEEEIIYIV